MEPISELATRITSHLWLLHELYPDEPSVVAVLSRNWSADLKRNAAADLSVLQLVLDLVCDSLDRESRATGSESERGRLWRRIIHRKAACKRAKETAEPAALTIRAVETMAERMNTVRQQGLDAELTFAATCPARVPDQRGQVSASKLLTREELFQNVANRLLRSEVSKLRVFADSFLWNAKFLMEEEITRCAEAIPKSGGKEAAAKVADDWMRKSVSERRDLVLDRAALRELCRRLAVPVPFSIVLSDELDEIARSRLVRLYGENADFSSAPPAAEARKRCGFPVELAIASEQASKSSLFGLALSGGGIRSATFALGLLQGMADRNLLAYIDILSTVSGGGYNAGANVSEPLQWVSRNSDPHSDHVRPNSAAARLRTLPAPQAGFFSADSWTIAATWFRNATLNLAVLTLFFAAALLLPRLAIFFLFHLGNIVGPSSNAAKLLLKTLLASVPLLAACVLIRVRNLNTFRGSAPVRTKGHVSQGDNDTQVVFGILPCIWIGAFLELGILWGSVLSQAEPWPVTAGFAITLTLGVGILGIGVTSRDEARLTRPMAFAVTVIFGSSLLNLLYSGRGILIMNTEQGLWIAGSAGFAAVLTWIAVIAGESGAGHSAPRYLPALPYSPF